MTADVKLLPLPKGEGGGLVEAWSYDQVRDYARANVAHATAALQAENERLRAAFEELLDALRQITEWPDGGNRYGQENIKRFAQAAIDAAMLKARENKA